VLDTVYEKYIRQDKIPHMWCPGCGNGTVMGSFCQAVEELGYDQSEVVVVSGIGCSGRISGYLDFNTLHTTHGRALGFATGIKLANPGLKVFVFMGDGDATAIGGNHLIHACRRNIDMTAIIINNNIYGMTGGQYSPMTPKGMYATTARYGSVDGNFDIANLVTAAGATYVARVGTFQVPLMKNLIMKAARHTGFSVVEALSQCPTNFGRRNMMASPTGIMMWQREHTVPVDTARGMTPEELKGKLVTGELRNVSACEYVTEYEKVIERAMKEVDQS